MDRDISADCSDAISVSLRASPTLKTIEPPSLTLFIPESIDFTASDISDCIVLIILAISLVDDAVLSLSALISSATTEKLLPYSPACAASIAAFRLRRFVCSVTSFITERIFSISADLVPRRVIISDECFTSSDIFSMPSTASTTAIIPTSDATSVTFEASADDSFALLSTSLTDAFISSIAAEVSSTAADASSVLAAIILAVWVISATTE